MKTRRFAFRCLALATAALLALAPGRAAAQTLGLASGDNLTVDSTGTHGTYHGATINNTTTAYSSPGGHPVQTSGTAAFTLGAGGSLTANADNVGAALDAGGSGQVTVTGGTLTANGHSGVALYAFSGPVTVFGGVYTANGVGGQALRTDNTSTVTVAGGSFSATGQSGTGLAAAGGTLDLFSQGDPPFLVNNVSMNNTTLAANTSGTISGTLLNGEAFSTTFLTSNGGVFELNVGTAPVLPAPEPSTWALLGVGACALGGLTLRRRRVRLA